MGFESGTISLRAYFLPRAWPEDALNRLAAKSAPPLKMLGVEEMHGWVGGRHLLDTPVTEDNAFFAGYLRLTLMQAVRQVPASLFRAECMMQELAWMRAEQKPFVDRSTRRQIRREVMDRLLPEMPPTLKGIPLVRDETARLLYTGALSDRQSDALCAAVRSALGLSLVPVSMETLAAQQARVNVREWGATSFSPELADGENEASPAEDFLTWLWYWSDAEGGLFRIREMGEVGVSLDGPLLFAVEGEHAAQEAVLRKGTPLASAEARTALMGGKKLRRCRLTIAQQNRTWTCSFDAATFVFRGLKMTEPEERLDAVSAFQNRMAELAAFFEIMAGLVERFCAVRGTPEEWRKTRSAIHRWASELRVRR